MAARLRLNDKRHVPLLFSISDFGQLKHEFSILSIDNVTNFFFLGNLLNRACDVGRHGILAMLLRRREWAVSKPNDSLVHALNAV
jgi:hypothetical protein